MHQLRIAITATLSMTLLTAVDRVVGGEEESPRDRLVAKNHVGPEKDLRDILVVEYCVFRPENYRSWIPAELDPEAVFNVAEILPNRFLGRSAGEFESDRTTRGSRSQRHQYFVKQPGGLYELAETDPIDIAHELRVVGTTFKNGRILIDDLSLELTGAIGRKAVDGVKLAVGEPSFANEFAGDSVDLTSGETVIWRLNRLDDTGHVVGEGSHWAVVRVSHKVGMDDE